jgi:hypothetical protein
MILYHYLTAYYFCRLIKYTVETTRTKLDRLYLEALQSSKRTQPASSEDVTALQEELESLYSELLPVAQMSVEQQYLGPALSALSKKRGLGVNRSTAGVAYVRSIAISLDPK